MTEHVLKTLAPYWDAVERGEKTFEVRRDDRGFQKGDVLVLKRTEPGTWSMLDGIGMELRCRVAYILTGGQFGIKPGHVVMSLEREEREEIAS